MKTTKKYLLTQSSLRAIIVVLLALGVFFRFVNLDQKAYWYDETFTSLQLSGYTAEEVTEQIIDGREIGLEDLNKYQYPAPDSEKTVIDTIEGVAKIEPQLTPLYFVMVRYWVQWFGNSVAITRSFSAVVSLLVFPCIYWLCLELFRSPLTGLIAMALMAVSPFHVLYAQEARPYSLWTVTILLSSASLLRAMRLQSIGSWIIYAGTVVLGLYSFLFSALVSIGHGIYILITERFRLSKKLIAYLTTSLAGFLFFVPWIYIVSLKASKLANKSQEPISLFGYIFKWVRSISLFFADFSLNESSPLVYLIPFSFVLLMVLALVSYSIYFLFRNSPERVWLFVLTLIATPALALILPDLIFGGQRSLVTRYLIPTFLGIQLAVAYLFATKLTPTASKLCSQKLWKGGIVVLISIGVLSSVNISQSEVWWNKADDNIHHTLASIINQAKKPVVISDDWFPNVLSFSHQLEPKVRFQLVIEPNIPEIGDDFSDVFLYKPSQNMKTELSKKYTLKNINKTNQVWRIDKKQ
ncbi:MULTISPECIES: glycosyltransferase family 39 protein [unclassified Coleofasciculus]|uniref:glycosyltransferase family 39 protein n=1 Tax=unclassified Coleofasciculus TaxID=2692782 RepID=UPI001881CD5E|nr:MULTISPECIES: glycosyltransferase family 39 protein [unclassified Coleofasciculus]MBE9127200.1 glycosyltransferase family 39 protein [Coleofasciculus sp. LEGE 07081]MBE9150310.1 glycosyltransferase family 39 protein [Coleofasciculus sp. LEGE 07092]